MLPLLVGPSAKPLAGLEPLFKYQGQEHYTNIHRMGWHAASHPLVRCCKPYRVNKAKDPSAFNEQGRCTKYQQSPWDLPMRPNNDGSRMPGGATNTEELRHRREEIP